MRREGHVAAVPADVRPVARDRSPAGRRLPAHPRGLARAAVVHIDVLARPHGIAAAVGVVWHQRGLGCEHHDLSIAAHIDARRATISGPFSAVARHADPCRRVRGPVLDEHVDRAVPVAGHQVRAGVGEHDIAAAVVEGRNGLCNPIARCAIAGRADEDRLRVGIRGGQNESERGGGKAGTTVEHTTGTGHGNLLMLTIGRIELRCVNIRDAAAGPDPTGAL